MYQTYHFIHLLTILHSFITYLKKKKILIDHITATVVIVLTSGVADHGFEPWSGQIKDYKIGICFFSIKVNTRKNKDWFTRN